MVTNNPGGQNAAFGQAHLCTAEFVLLHRLGYGQRRAVLSQNCERLRKIMMQQSQEKCPLRAQWAKLAPPDYLPGK
jgi:hypothetical protein